MNDLTNTGNLIEAGLWFCVALVLFVKGLGSGRRFRRVFGVLSAAFLVFGVSDIIEAQTGAWWRPFWLLIIKIVCLAVFAAGFRAYYRIRKLL